ncbi:type IV pilus biogenesis protein PilP [Trinickia fusca]|uniref:Type IV pilus biogenesis protein PilP n=1 Tax=Trinickia fusca TaxID=2419777 RepID=A0A494XHD0_9BURK|nr:type IV pilus biogenesis protein PilP [Trinickia fusca]RKP47569.1 type IV pilus biogenesis protein PilP [Trinickia fusca]
MHMHKHKPKNPTIASLIALTATAFAIPCAFAQDDASAQAAPPAKPAVTATASSMSPADELADLQAQIMILEAKAKIAKLRVEIDTAGAPPQAMQAPGMGMPVMPPMSMNMAPSASPSAPGAAAATHGAGGMQVVSISCFDNHCNAMLSVDGHNVAVRQGDTIDGGWKVTGITDSSITLARGKQVHVLRS